MVKEPLMANHLSVFTWKPTQKLEFWGLSRISKSGQPALWVLCSVHHLIVLNICIKFHENIINAFQVTERTWAYGRNHYFECSKGHNSKSKQVRVIGLVYCMLPHDAWHLYIKFHENIANGFRVTEQTRNVTDRRTYSGEKTICHPTLLWGRHNKVSHV